MVSDPRFRLIRADSPAEVIHSTAKAIARTYEWNAAIVLQCELNAAKRKNERKDREIAEARELISVIPRLSVTKQMREKVEAWRVRNTPPTVEEKTA